MTPLPRDRLCIHQITLMQCGFVEALDCLARHQVPMTAIWQDKLEDIGTRAAAVALRDTGIRPVALCIGGVMSSGDKASRAEQIDLTRRRIGQCADLGIPGLVMLSGGLDDGARDLHAARANAMDGFAQVLGEARDAGVRLVLEPLHPMVCGLRSVLSTLGDACDFLDELDADDITGLALDTYALWWDLHLADDIARAGGRLCNFHVSDWLPDTMDVRLDRGMPGDGRIDNRAIRALVEGAGYSGPVEVEVMSKRRWWSLPPDEVVAEIVARAPLHL